MTSTQGTRDPLRDNEDLIEVDTSSRRLRVLYSFPLAIGSPGIGTTALNEVRGLVARGVKVTLYCTSIARGLPDSTMSITQTLVVGSRRIPHRALGVDRAYRYHDWRVARALAAAPEAYDVVHAWPLASTQTFRVARSERVASARASPNCYTAVAYERVAAEAARLGLTVPRNASHHFNAERLAREEVEYELATAILAPSAFVERSYAQRPGNPLHILRHSYGFDPADFPEPHEARSCDGGLRVAFVGSCEPRKGIHHALDAWHASGLPRQGGHLVICGRWESDYRALVASRLDDPSIEVRPFTDDVGALLRSVDALVLPSVEEGSALVTYEAQACGCVLLVSDASGALAEHGIHGLVHTAGDVTALTSHLRQLADDPKLLARQRAAVLAHRDQLTWTAAAERLERAYVAALDIASA